MRTGRVMLIFVLGILLLGFASANYVKTNNIEFNSQSGYSFGDYEQTMFDNKMCEEGQDFVLQIAPGGCSPAIVRSDLLEEQDVPVFCEIQAIKINPLVGIEAIDSMSFSHNGNPNIRSVGFQPRYDALGGGRVLTDNMWNNIGSAVFILRQNKNESSMPEIISGNISATLRYDLKDAFGLRKHTFYLPSMEDSEYNSRMGQYAFFDKRGYLRAQDIQSDSATFTIYSGNLRNPYTENSDDLQVLQSYTLSKGEKTPDLLLPGLDCMSAVNFELESIEVEDVRAQLKINSEIIEVGENEKFLGDRCWVVDDEIKKNGLNQQVKISCRDDNKKTETFTLRISPSVKLSIDGDEREYKLGEEIFSDGERKYFLGYVGYEEDPKTYEQILDASIVSLPTQNVDKSGRLTENQLENVACVRNKETSVGSIGCATYGAARWLVQGDWIFNVDSDGETVADKFITIQGLGVVGNSPFVGNKTEILEKYFNLANEDFDFVATSFEGEKYPENNLQTISEESLYEEMQLAKALWQKTDFAVLCEEFRSRYPNSRLNDPDCDNSLYKANFGVSSANVMIDGDFKEITLQRINMPSIKDYGLEMYVSGKATEGNDDLSRPVQMGKDSILYLNDKKTEWIQVVSIDEDSAQVKVKLDKTSFNTKIAKQFFETRTLVEDHAETFGSEYNFVIRNTNVNRVAKIVVNPSVKYTGSKAEFNYHIGVEKRDIQLSPEMTEKVIKKLENTIEQFNSINERLGSVIDTMEKACLATGAFLNAKNLIFNSGGKAIARGEVMDYWKVYCAEAVNNGTYSSQDACYLKNADSIDSEVDAMAEKLKEQDSVIKGMQNVTKTGLFGDKVVDTDDLAIKYSKRVADKLRDFSPSEITNKYGETINLDRVANELTFDRYKNGIYTIDELKEIELYLDLYGKTGEVRHKEKLFSALFQVNKNLEHILQVDRAAADNQIDASKVLSLSLSDDVRKVPYTDLKLIDIDFDLPGYLIDRTPVQVVQTTYGNYILVLNDDYKKNEMVIDRRDGEYQIYDSDKELVTDEKIVNMLTSNFVFVKYDEKMYKNSFSNNKEYAVRYYEVEPYKGLPAIVPLSKSQGWYAHIDQTIPAFGNAASYDDSGRVSRFNLCNVGENGLLQADKGLGDDICQTISLTTGTIPEFYGLTQEQTKKLVDQAVDAIYAASKAHGSGVKSIKIGDERVTVGSPLVNLPAGDCSDYMSPKECNLLFNLCDPVVCPASRCDLGGEYPVQDVVQSGVIGSLALCLPNAQEGIYVPVCLTGVKAGLEGFNSVLGAYKSCLEQNLETGETVGICDEIHSVQICEFFWRQGIPLAKVAIPKLLKLATGQTTRGGGEYSGVESAWKAAQDSVSFFTEFYAVNAFKVFKARGQEEIGTELCNAFVSTSYPTGQGIFDSLSLSTSPPQFNANFDAIPMTSKTNPPMVHYKVFYHIYAGNDRGAYFKVYLRGSDSSYYQDADLGRLVGSGYIPKGESQTITEDFTGPQGYKEVCVQVNDQVECGFGKVSTSFAANYVQDQYIKNQALQNDIRTEKECISGTASAASLLNLNVQSAAEELIDPAIYNKGLIRVCATNQPGASTDPDFNTTRQRWVDVGYCDNPQMRCWLDRDSVDDAVNWDATYQDFLNESTNDYLKKLYQNGQYMDEVEFDSFIENNLTELENYEEVYVKARSDLIDSVVPRVFLSNQKAFLYFKRGELYSDFSKYLFNTFMLERLKEIEDYDDEIDEDLDIKESGYNIQTVRDVVDAEGYVSPVFEFADGQIAENPCFIFEDSVWKWKPTCDVQVGTWFNMSVGNNLGKGYSDLVEGLDGEDFLTGLKALMTKTVKDDLSNQFSNADLLVENVANFDHNEIFELKTHELYFKYDDNKWFWSGESTPRYDSLNWLSVENVEQSHLETSVLGVVMQMFGNVGASPVDLDKYKLEGDSVKLGYALRTSNLEEGAALIFGAVSTSDIEKMIYTFQGWTPAKARSKAYELNFTYGEKATYQTKDVAFFIDSLAEEGLINDFEAESFMAEFKHVLEVVELLDDRVDPEDQYPIVDAKDLEGACSPYDSQFMFSSNANNIPVEMLKSVAFHESSCRPDAISNTGCRGIMQFCSAAAYQYKLCELKNCDSNGYDNRYNPEASIEAGADMLSDLMIHYAIHKDISQADQEKLSLAAYNGGIGFINKAVENADEVTWVSVSKALTLDLFDEFTSYSKYSTAQREAKIKEIRDYVGKVYGTMQELRGEESSGSLKSEYLSLIKGTESYSHDGFSKNQDKIFELVKKDISLANLKNEDGQFLLLFSVLNGYDEITNYLVDNGANINLMHDKGKYTALFLSSERGYAESTKKLLDGGASVNLVDSQGNSPLSSAALCGSTLLSSGEGGNYMLTIQYLVEAGADINHVTKFGSVYDSAEKSCSSDIINYLRLNEAQSSEELGLSGDFPASSSEVLELSNNNWPVRSTIDYMSSLSGDYGSNDNSYVIDLMCKDGLFNDEECTDIKGEGGFFDWEDSMSSVTKRLRVKAIEKFGGKNIDELSDADTFLGGIEKTMTIMQAYLKVRDLVERGETDYELVNQIRREGHITKQEYDLYAEKGFDFEFLLGVLESKVYPKGDGNSSGEKSCDAGKVISDAAKAKIGSDTTRVEEGVEVKTSVCATFVSNVLIEAGALPMFDSCSADTIPVRDAIFELNGIFEKQSTYSQVNPNSFLNGLSQGDILIWGDSGSSQVHITIFDRYDANGNFYVIHDGGKDVNVKESLYLKANHEKKSWYVSKAWRVADFC